MFKIQSVLVSVKNEEDEVVDTAAAAVTMNEVRDMLVDLGLEGKSFIVYSRLSMFYPFTVLFHNSDEAPANKALKGIVPPL
jgi:hypothetical protein